MLHKTLLNVNDGESCVICAINMEESAAQRIMDMGFRPGEEILRLIAAPSGTPIAFWVQGSVIALRAIACANIEVACRA